MQYFNELVERYCTINDINIEDVIRNGSFKDEVKKNYKRQLEQDEQDNNSSQDNKRSKSNIEDGEEDPNSLPEP